MTITISNCSTSGSIESPRAGGIAVDINANNVEDVIIEDCISQTDIVAHSGAPIANTLKLGKSGSPTPITGSTTVDNCLAEGSVDYGDFSGYSKSNSEHSGFVGTVDSVDGDTDDVTIDSCTTTADVSGYIIRGFVAENADSTILNSDTSAELSAYDDANVSGASSAGFVGSNSGLVEDCERTGDVTQPFSNIVSGFVGTNSGTIQSSIVDGAVKSASGIAAGFCLQNQSTIETSGALVDATTTNGNSQPFNISTTGFVGQNSGTVERCFSKCTIDSSADIAAGFVGTNNGSISNTYAQVSSFESDTSTISGGYVSVNENVVDTSYVAVVGGVTNGQAFATENNGDITDSYYDETLDSSAVVGTEGTPSTTDITPLQTPLMKGDSAETNMSLFDFNTVWQVVSDSSKKIPEDDYPILRDISLDEQLELRDIFEVTIDAGEAVVGGAWLARDEKTTVVAERGESIYLGWKHNQSDTVIIGTEDEFSDKDEKTKIYEV